MTNLILQLTIKYKNQDVIENIFQFFSVIFECQATLGKYKKKRNLSFAFFYQKLMKTCTIQTFSILGRPESIKISHRLNNKFGCFGESSFKNQTLSTNNTTLDYIIKHNRKVLVRLCEPF